jgi:hypothetical protein
MYNEIAMMDDTMKNIVSRLYVYAPTLAGLEERITALAKGLEGDNYRCGISLNETKADFEALVMPSSHQQKSLYRKRGQPLLSSALAAGNPFNYTTLSDPYGTYYGMSTNGGGVINLDLFRVTDMRMSYNSVLVGKMGSGKSTTLKKMVTERAIRGDTIRVFDPTGEFTGLADYLGGRVVSLDGQSGNIINALQILKAGDNTRISYNQHFSKVSTIYRYLQPEASYQEVLMMEQVLRKLYQLKGFTAEDGTPLPDACDRPPERYPIWSDYLKLVRLYQEKFADSGNSAEYLHLKAIELVIDNLVESYGNMFDGFTVVKDLHAEQIICFDISELKSMKDQIFDAQLFSALSLCWDNCVASGARMKQAYDRGEIEMKDVKRFLITIDEAHRIINANKLTGVEQISLFAREARKYFGGIALASQSIRDFVPDNASSSGIDQITRLFELSTYKFVMQQDASASAKFRQVFAGQFSEHEIAQIPVLEKGQTILAISGDQNLTFKVEVSDEELALFAGGA